MPIIRLLLLLGLAIAFGCGGTRDRAPVSGTVTWNGQPIADGYISMFSAPKVPAGGGAIKQGNFAFLSKTGQLTVEIVATREGKYDPGEKATTREQYLPEKFNRATVLRSEVALDGKNTFVFALTAE